VNNHYKIIHYKKTFDALIKNKTITSLGRYKSSFYINKRKLFFKEEVDRMYYELLGNSIAEYLNINYTYYEPTIIKTATREIKGLVAKDYRREGYSLVKFNFNNKDYLVYFIDENEENKQIFVSRLILNSEGKYFIDNIMPEEKAKLSEIVYNIVILIPTNNQKGEPADKLLSSLTEKYTLLLSNDIPTLGEQEYYNNCSIAITSKELVGLAEVFYNTNLKVEEPVLKTSEVPTWEIPSSNEVVQPVEQAVSTVPIFTSAENENTLSPEVKAKEPMVNETPVVEPIPPVVNNNSQATNVIPNTTEEMPANTLNNNLANNSINNNVNNILPENNMPNPQAEKLAIVSDPSLASITGTVPIAGQPNVAKLNNKGKANVKYIIIGTICILLAIAVVVVAYILIQKKTTGV